MAYTNEKEDEKIRNRFRKIFDQKIRESMNQGGSLIGGEYDMMGGDYHYDMIGGASGRGQTHMDRKKNMRKNIKKSLKKRIKGSSFIGGDVIGKVKPRRKTYKTRDKIKTRNKLRGKSFVGGKRKNKNPWVEFFMEYSKQNPHLKGREIMHEAGKEYRKMKRRM